MDNDKDEGKKKTLHNMTGLMKTPKSRISDEELEEWNSSNINTFQSSGVSAVAQFELRNNLYSLQI